MVCMMFIAHTISELQLTFNMCLPDAYGGCFGGETFSSVHLWGRARMEE
jgi:hypothetical protein